MTSLTPIEGRVAYIFAEDNFDADQIVGPENLTEQDIDRLIAVAMRQFDPDFAAHVRPGDILVGGRNFGYGHPHYPPMLAMRRLGITAVVAEYFAPGYWREEMEEGFPQITCPGIVAAAGRWDTVRIDFERNELLNLTRNVRCAIEPFSPAETRMLAAGGLNRYLQLRMRDERNSDQAPPVS
jgi:3-isopropylmalate/(R)-2-methylmalate dehydratase small subunit